MPSKENSDVDATQAVHHDLAIDDGDDDSVPECGVGRFKPKALRMCATMAAFTGASSGIGLLSSTTTTYVNSQVTTLERHFGFNSSQTGLIMAANDVGFLVVVLFASYITSKLHIPRSLGSLTVMYGLSAIVCSLPQFMFGAPSYSSDVSAQNTTVVTSYSSSRRFGGQLCDGINETGMDCDVKETDIPSGATSRVTSAARTHAGVAMAVIVVGMVLQGMSKAPRSAFLVTFVDDNVEKTRTGFHMGIITTFGMMGPALAFLLGGIFTKMYVTLEEKNLHPRHPKWIGAWWLGYLVFGCASCVFALPLFMFPRRIKEPLSEKKSIRRNSKPGVVGELSTLVKGLVGALYRLLSNPVYMCTMLSACALLFSVAGGQSFTAKYIENQFSLTAWRTNLSMAATLLGTACLGTFFGGYVSKRFKMEAVSSLKFIVVMQILSVVATSLGLAFKCEQPNIHNSPGPRAIFEEAMSGCYDDCACDDDDYFPICDGDGRTFFSPCHAGCSGNIGNDYVNCTCIPGSKASAGMCDYSCFMFYPFIASVCASTLFGTLSIIPKLVVYIRCVEDRDRPIALGLSAFMQSLTGWMLAPIVFGKLIDDICIQWENGEDSCTGRGACRLYDNDVFRWKLIGYQALFRFVGLVFTFSSLVIAVVTKKFDSVETENLNTLDAFEQVTRPFKTADKATDITNFPV